MTSAKNAVVFLLFLGVLLAGCSSRPGPAPGSEAVGVQLPQTESNQPDSQAREQGSFSGKPGAAYKTVSAGEAKALAGNGVFVLDVRTQAEFDESHIEGAYLLPHTEVSARHQELGLPKDAPVLVICRSGKRSALASQELADLGYTNVLNVAGGMNAWNEKGFPVSGEKKADAAAAFESPLVKETMERIMPKGVPAYGNEEEINFGRPEDSLNFLAWFDRQNVLAGEEKERYDLATAQMTCEYCCGPVNINECACLHASAYRGLAKYLARNFPEMSGAEMVAEQGKWKTIWFPKQSVLRALAAELKEGRITEDDLGALNEMVGTC